jgi:hypothetical protein
VTKEAQRQGWLVVTVGLVTIGQLFWAGAVLVGFGTTCTFLSDSPCRTVEYAAAGGFVVAVAAGVVAVLVRGPVYVRLPAYLIASLVIGLVELRIAESWNSS